VPHEVNVDKKIGNEDLKPLKISCTSTDCANNLHCFQLTQKLKRNGPAGRCRTCGAELVDWARVHRVDLADVNYTFEMMRYELIRHHFWHVPISMYAVNYARRKGLLRLKQAARKQIERAVKGVAHPREGQQTARETNPHANLIHYAQHATASCCRKCVEEWHGIPRDRELTAPDIDYLTELAMLYAESRLPDLSEAPVYVPPTGRMRLNPSQSSRIEQPHAH